MQTQLKSEIWRRRLRRNGMVVPWVAMVLTVGATVAGARPDYGRARRPALALLRDGAHAEAFDAFLALHDGARNDHQRADALEQAAMAALGLERFDEALALARQIPLRPQSRTVQMRLLARQERWQAILDDFADDAVADWPRSVAAEAYHLRGLAHHRLDAPKAALREWVEAARRTENPQVFFDLGNLAMSLNEDVIAMDAYGDFQRAGPEGRGGWRYYTAIVARARILLRNGIYAYALDELDKAGEGVGGYWRVQVLTERGRALAALGKREQANAVFEAALATEGIYNVQRNRIAQLREAL